MKLFRLIASVLTLATLTATAQNSCRIHQYNSNDGGILTTITPSGEWALINLGTTAGGGNATSKLYHVDDETIIPLEYAGRALSINAISDDASIVVGSLAGKAIAYNRATGTIKAFPNRNLWQSGSLDYVTPDGKWAVGHYNGYMGIASANEDLTGDYYYSTLLVNIETGDTIATPGLPTRDMAHLNQNAITFRSITPDGRYAVGEMDWYIMQPNSPVVFVYDTQEHTTRIVGFTPHDNRDWEPLAENLHHLEVPVLSPDGHWLAGMAYMSKTVSGSEFNSEYGVPFRYDITTGQFEVFDGTEITVDDVCIDNAGTLFGNPNTGSPLRDFRILYKDKFWISLSQICKQYYGFNWSARTGYERTGSVTGISGDGSRIVAFPDPLSESYCIDFGCPVEDICAHVDLLDNYTVTPAAGSVFSSISTIEINFGRAVQVVGRGSTHVHLYKADGTKVADALSTSGGLTMKTGSSTTVNAVFRTRGLEAGMQYYVVIDAGAVAVAGDATLTNKEIRISYAGRHDGPVTAKSIVPEEGSTLRQLDATSAYILISFDCPVKVTEAASAYLERIEDGTHVATLSVAEGNSASTRHQVLLYPAGTVYLYDGLHYRVVLEEGSVTDYSGQENSGNQPITVSYTGSYIREVSNDKVLFEDDFSDPASSYAVWLRYEGDHHTPLATMSAMSFDADNMPWQFGLADDETYADPFAASHSLYSPSAQSDDWMMTPQLLLPTEGKTVLSFDAQSYMPNKQDVLKVYIFEEEFEIPVLTSAWMEDVRSRSVLLDSITLSAGQQQEITAGEWTHYSYSLAPWAGKNIYVVFANQNRNQSMIFLDNVAVQRELVYSFGFSTPDRVVNQSAITLAGQLTVHTADPVDAISLVLRDAAGNEISRVQWPTISGNVRERPLPFSFPQPLPLTVGMVNEYTIDVTVGQHQEVYAGSVADMTFLPTKRVVLEEVTGIDCQNCPQGILTIEKCRQSFGDQFIPISIHTYIGDPYAGSMTGYSDFLGLISSPSARINRLGKIYYPMVTVNGVYTDTYPDDPVWLDIVTQELSVPPLFDVALKAEQSADGRNVTFDTNVTYALDATGQQLSLLIVVLEDGLVNYQNNNLGAMTQELFGEWGQGGIYSGANSGGYAYPVTHNDVARAVIGQTYAGTIGLFPSNVKAGQTYTATVTSAFPAAVTDATKASAVAIVIDAQTGQIVGADHAPIYAHGQNVAPATLVPGDGVARNLQGLPVGDDYRGIVIVNGQKQVRK